MLEFIRRLVKPRYGTLNYLEIKADRLLANYAYLQSLQPEAEIFPVLKSNAYGHGLKEVCLILNSSKAKMVAVDSYPEAQIVYRYFRGKVLILGEMPLKAYDYCRLERTEFVVYNSATLKYLARFGRKARVHLFVNSGMNREGLQDMSAFIASHKKYLDRVQVSGLCSHLASAEENSPLNSRQETVFRDSLNALRQAGFFPRWVHLGNSAAIFTMDDKLLTAFRAGLSFYGYSPFADDPDGNREAAAKASRLRPALEAYSQLVAVQELKAGESVSYNESYRAPSDTRIGVIPFGYFEGLDRRLSNQAKFLVRTKDENFWSVVAGRICMNLACLDLGSHAASIGDLVQIVSARTEDPNSITNLAHLSATIPYEVLVRFQANIRRKIV